jgi:aminopeptidase
VDERLERYAELCVRVGANVQPGQELFVEALVEHAPLARAITRQGYRAGASYVHVLYLDEHAKHAMIELGPDEALTCSPGWRKAFVEEGEGNAFIATLGDPEPELMADLDGRRVGRAVMQEVNEIVLRQLRESSVNWCAVGAPNEG